jgi:hypothetical protein
MPTTLPRVQVTETPPVRQALAVGMLAWPEAKRAEAAARLMELGAQALQVRRLNESSQRRERLLGSFGMFSGVYTDGYLDELRADWSE